MQTLAQQRMLIVGGSRGLGLGVMQALMARHANVTVMARDSAGLAALEAQCGVSIIPGDATDPRLAESVLRELRPTVVVLNAGATPAMAPLDQQSWESFSRNWDTDVKATFQWIQGVLRLPLDRGARVLVSASGSAMDGSPLSGGYAGAKGMIWLMAGYANGVARDLDLGIRFQALLLRQIVDDRARTRRCGSVCASQGRQHGGVPGRFWLSPQCARVRRARHDRADRPAVRERARVRDPRRHAHSAARRVVPYRIFNDPGCAGSPYGRRRKVRHSVPGIS